MPDNSTEATRHPLKELLDSPFALVSLLIVALVVVMLLMPYYGVFKNGLAGEAELKRAESNRKIAILEAEAKKASAVLLAEAEVERARGVAEANRIIGDSLKGNESYLRWLWISNLENTKGTVIYVPTETGLPILEAGKRESVRREPDKR
jgi:hypothetical protein